MVNVQGFAKKLGKTHILIIEDSVATAKLIAKYLKKLGYPNIHVCYTGWDGIKKFEKLIKSNNAPLVFLDYYLPDFDALSLFTQLLEKNKETKVVIETVGDANKDPGLKYLISHGAYYYMKKPITLKKLEVLMTTFEHEHVVLE